MNTVRARLRKSVVPVIFVLVMLALAPTAGAQETSSPGLPAGWIPPTPGGIFAEPTILRQVVNSSDSGMLRDAEREDGPYAEFGNMISGSGWISAGPGYRKHVLNGVALIDASAAVSWNLFKVAQVRLESLHLAKDRLAVGVQAFYQDLAAVEYFGLGNDSRETDRSAYRLTETDLLGYATARPRSWLSVSGRVGWIPRPDLSAPRGPAGGLPNTIAQFSGASAPGVGTLSSYLHGDLSLAADWRDNRGHPTSGGLYRVSAASYSDLDAGPNRFRRYEVEGSQFIPLFARNWVLALHAWEVFSDTPAGGIVPFYLLPSLGGHNTLRGYDNYRFHDANMQVVNLESRWALLAHVDVAAFVDAGKVAPHAGDLDFRHLKRSYGAGLRVHNARSTLVRIDAGHGAEGWSLYLKISDAFKRSTPASGRSSVLPFVP